MSTTAERRATSLSPERPAVASSRRPRWRFVPQQVVVHLVGAVLVSGAMLLGAATKLPDSTLALVWPAGGVAALWMLAVRRRPWVGWVTLALVVTATNAATNIPLVLSAAFGLSNLLQATLFVALLRRLVPSLWGVGGRDTVERALVLGQVALASVVAVGVTIALSAPVMAQLGLVTPTGELFVWAGRNVVGLFAVFVTGHLLGHRAWVGDVVSLQDARPPEVVAITVVTAAAYLVVFGPSHLPLSFLPVVTTVWAALRLGVAGTAVQVFAAGTWAVTGTILGGGPLVDISARSQALIAQLFVVVAMTVGLLLVMARHRLAVSETRLQDAGEELQAKAAELADQGELLNAVLESLNEGVMVLDADGRPAYANPAARRLYRSLGMDGLDTASLEVHTPDGRRLEPHELPSARGAAGERVPPTSYVARGSNGERRVLEASAQPVRHRGRHSRRASVVFRDVTAQHDRLRDLESFAGVVAHDLKGPLAAVASFADALRLELDDVEGTGPLVGHMLDRIEANAGTMSRLIEDLLLHVTSRQRELEPEVLDISGLAREVARLRGVESQVEAGWAPAVRGDRTLVRHLVDNLVGNAVKYVAPGVVPHVVVEAELVQPDRSWVRISVTDNGVGIPDDQREKVFDEFHRVGGTSAGGTGLGLAICRTVVDRHGGDIWVEAGPDGVGSRFVLTLPAEPAYAPVVPLPRTEPGARLSLTARLPG